LRTKVSFLVGKSRPNPQRSKTLRKKVWGTPPSRGVST
jgi:hypothetical protein